MFGELFKMVWGSTKEKHYTCEGCKAHLTEEEYKNHSTKVCETEGCPNMGKPFSEEHQHEEEKV